jgi:hypothetical protein
LRRYVRDFPTGRFNAVGRIRQKGRGLSRREAMTSGLTLGSKE